MGLVLRQRKCTTLSDIELIVCMPGRQWEPVGKDGANCGRAGKISSAFVRNLCMYTIPTIFLISLFV